ncbi:MAG TPA: aromatic ring-hydroxylating dioxygenase subunit alpha [Acidimicrobiia bacterium]|nr:aromatic ring-hydroxylating dioxygenase subunit alpha [Acidimicrobiia bacterium]
MARNFPYESLPTGWFQVAWGDDLAVGETTPLTYFGRELVLYRGESGRPVVFDAFCPHLGAHLAYGGKVCADDIVCPFHGWRFDAEGANVEIPYWDKPNRAQRLNPWAVREVNGWILVWHDAEGRPPSWEPPALPEAADPAYWSGAAVRRFNARVRVHPQMVVENLVDAPHQQYVHKGAEPADIYDYRDEGPFFRVYNRVLLGVGKGKNWLTDGVKTAEMHTESWGVGIAVARFVDQDDSVHVQTVTPIDDEWADLRATVWLRRDTIEVADDGTPDEATLKRFDFEMRQLDRDIVIWEHMTYVPHGPFAGMEVRPYNAFRRWATQFYPDAADKEPRKVSLREAQA